MQNFRQEVTQNVYPLAEEQTSLINFYIEFLHIVCFNCDLKVIAKKTKK